MIKAGKHSSERIVDLCGPQGNAYALLGMAKGFAKQLDLDWEPIKSEMTSGNYSDLVLAMDKYFGEYVTFVNAKQAGVKIENDCEDDECEDDEE